MTSEKKYPPQLFILHLWPETLADGQIEWRGKLNHTQTNEIRYFRDWPALIPLLLSLLRQADMPISTAPAAFSGEPPPQSEADAEMPQM